MRLPAAPTASRRSRSAVTSNDAQRPLDRATQEVETARGRGFERLAADNARAWMRRWETDIEVEGSPELQRVVRSMLFYLLCSADSGTKLGIPPMGLSSAGYYGHIFWDSDTWMFPSLLLTHPDVAHSLVAFRARTLPAARENARANGFRGAMYPWEARRARRGDHAAVRHPECPLRDSRDRRRRPGTVAVLPGQWRLHLAGRAKAFPSSGKPPTSGSAVRPVMRPTNAVTSRTWSRWRRG